MIGLVVRPSSPSPYGSYGLDRMTGSLGRAYLAALAMRLLRPTPDENKGFGYASPLTRHELWGLIRWTYT